MVYKKFKDEEGEYIDASSQRWTIMEAHEAYTPEGLNVGWDEYPNLGTATQAYGLIYQPLEVAE
jgi:hypothetical protein